MLTLEQRLDYWSKIEAARSAWLADPELAAEYRQASRAWDATVEGRPRDEGDPSTGRADVTGRTA